VAVTAGVVTGGEAGKASPAEVLAAALEANRELSRLAGELREDNARLRAENAGLRERNDAMAAELAILKRMVFGRSSERARPDALPAGGGGGQAGGQGREKGKRARGPGQGGGTTATCRKLR